MAALQATRRPSAAVPTSSMADIAFLLLVFFLVTTVFPRDDGLALVLPRHSTEVSQANILHIIVAPSGRVEVRMGANAQTRIVSAEEIAAIWRSAVADNPKLIAAVKVDPDAAYGRMIAVLDALQGVGATRVSVQVLPR